MEAEEIQNSECHNSKKNPACLLGIAVVVPAASLVVSGSVVLAGNTLHWLEYQGRCGHLG